MEQTQSRFNIFLLKYSLQRLLEFLNTFFASGLIFRFAFRLAKYCKKSLSPSYWRTKFKHKLSPRCDTEWNHTLRCDSTRAALAPHPDPATNSISDKPIVGQTQYAINLIRQKSYKSVASGVFPLQSFREQIKVNM